MQTLIRLLCLKATENNSDVIFILREKGKKKSTPYHSSDHKYLRPQNTISDVDFHNPQEEYDSVDTVYHFSC